LVKFYNVESGGDSVGPVLKFSNTELRDGVFQLSLNFDNGQLSTIFGDGSKPAFVEVEAGGRVYPRQRLIAVPLALRVPVDTSTLNYTNEGKLTVENVDISKITGLTAALAAKANASTNLSDLSSPATARTNLGLGTLATSSAVTSALITDGTIVDGDINASAAIADTKLATISTAGKVSGSAITSGTIAGSTIFNTTGAVTTSAAITCQNIIVNATDAAATELRFNDDNNSNFVGFKAPGTVGTNRIWTLPAADGTNGQLLRTDGSGALSWVSATAASAPEELAA
jgi:hypothetical protein